MTLTRSAEASQSFDVLAEAYAGHDRDLPIYQPACVSIVNEELEQFFIDLSCSSYVMVLSLPRYSVRD
ncbi:MAG: hypothetical protein K6T85_16440 [Gorillibacterium sp.]|nr:hypothetical protein [Gorillibacterium sp.]